MAGRTTFLMVLLLGLPAPAAPPPAGPLVNPRSDCPLEYYSQGGVVVDGVAYFTADDGCCVTTGLRAPEFHSVVAFDLNTLEKVRTYHFDKTYDSAPLVFTRRDGTWLVIAHEWKKNRTLALRRDDGQVAWASAANEPGNYFFGYSYYRNDDGSKILFAAVANGLHALSSETGEDLWHLPAAAAGGVTPCVDQRRGVVYYQATGRLWKLDARSGRVLAEVRVPSPNACTSWNTVLVDDTHGYYVATRWYGKPEWDSALRVYDADLRLVWEHTGLPIGKKDTLTYADGRLVTGSGNHWSKGGYAGDAWKYVAARSIRDGRVLWRCDLSQLPYESLFNLPYFNGYLYAETTGGKHGPSKLMRIDATAGTLEESLDYGRSVSSCAPCILARGLVLSGDLGQDRIVVTRVAENSRLDWPGPFGDPQKNTFALPDEPGARRVPMREIGR